MKKAIKMGWIGQLLLLSATLIWGSSFIILKETLDELENFTFLILAIRFLSAALIFILIFFSKSIIIGKKPEINKKTILNGVFLGVILFIAYAVQTMGLKYTTSSKNSFLTAVYCIVVPFLAWIILKKRPKINNLIASVICLAGIGFVALSGSKGKGDNESLGDMLTLCCGVFYALQIIFNKKFASEDDPIKLLMIEVFTVGIFCLAVSGIFEIPEHHAEFYLNTQIIFSLVFLSVFATCFAQFAQLFGQKYTTPTSASIILSLEAVFGVMFSVIIGNEKPTWQMYVGFVVIFVAVLMSELGFDIFKKKEKKPKEVQITENK